LGILVERVCGAFGFRDLVEPLSRAAARPRAAFGLRVGCRRPGLSDDARDEAESLILAQNERWRRA
jgi:hypothetical protein